MPELRRRERLWLLVSALLLRQFVSYSVVTESAFFVVQYVIYYGILIGWAVSVKYRVIRRSIARYLIFMVAAMCVWMLIQIIQKRMVNSGSDYDRVLSYANMVPLIFMTLFSYMATLGMGQARIGRTSSILIFCLAVILSLMALLNDYHHLLYRYLPEGAGTGREYYFGPLRHIIYVWNIFFIALTLYGIFRRCNIPTIRRRIWIPVLIMCFLLIYGITYGIQPFILALNVRLIEKHQAVSISLIMLWECCFQLGLVPTNTGYEKLFQVSSVRAEIEDNSGQTVHVTSGFIPVVEDKRKAALKDTVMVTENLRLRATQIRGGNVFWEDDLTQIRSTQSQLIEDRRILYERIDLLEAENRTNANQIQTNEQNRVYDRITAAVRPELAQIQKLAANPLNDRNQLVRISVLGVYIKRFANMMLLADQNEFIDAGELVLSVQESIRYLQLGQFFCRVNGVLQGPAEAEGLMKMYQVLEWVMEAQFDSLQALLVDMSREENRLQMQITCEPALVTDHIPSLSGMGNLLDLQIHTEDDVTMILLTLARGGEIW